MKSMFLVNAAKETQKRGKDALRWMAATASQESSSDLDKDQMI